MSKINEAKEKIFHARMIKNFELYTAQEVFEKNLKMKNLLILKISGLLNMLHLMKGREELIKIQMVKINQEFK